MIKLFYWILALFLLGLIVLVILGIISWLYGLFGGGVAIGFLVLGILALKHFNNK